MEVRRAVSQGEASNAMAHERWGLLQKEREDQHSYNS